MIEGIGIRYGMGPLIERFTGGMGQLITIGMGHSIGDCWLILMWPAAWVN